ncbi:bifunctional adenosylcobinamide kinase/adenosylcobinamide-phosphate guanylyltransferase [Sinanaerobacter chloroacetimidivorans]|uniref:Adenosylcobinamide kinase n=1 Tax=Sinanaerobacter chloroacetimidivorans TaxID=2818044 RepID=A0A8J7W512_9FIRM|nr:bifunctional adenosylcobinamide kinase/adenosylcobinamide-phosphate guanylyltransferase [Sinanaerobacter chloroacetimidivorans]MBR0599075.1 bifunctional adenosylcobinamide kinase/adenosylcobinamide-phosphate guanylyltransferase [Sinanaerobacter chloroacetimidivorans]
MNILISGGSKNGKSYYAQQLAKKQACGGPLYYIATMEPVDKEDHLRIRRHQAEREGWGFTTIEQGRRICDIQADWKGSFLLDSVTALLSNEMFSSDGTVEEKAYLHVASDLEAFAQKSGNTVFVSDYIYSDAIHYEKLTEDYRKGLAYIDRTLAAVCDLVIEVAFGNIILIKGEGAGLL